MKKLHLSLLFLFIAQLFVSVIHPHEPRADAHQKRSEKRECEKVGKQRKHAAIIHPAHLFSKAFPRYVSLMRSETVVILHNIRSAYNVGAIFRTADGAGVSKIYLTGYTPTPLDAFGRYRTDIAKSALGAERIVPWEYAKKASAVIEKLKRDGFSVVAAEKTEGAACYREYAPRKRTAFLFGNEVRGISKALLSRCDAIVAIPMRGKKESLNVSVAAGIILYGMREV